MDSNLTVNVISTTKIKAAKLKHLKLPKEVFGQDVNEKLLAQALRVYSFNKRQGTVKAKTRAEVVGSRRKIWRQKGTGRARHADRYAPIFVGGGVAHGPRPRDWSRKLPKKMRRKALFSALSAKLADNSIYIFEGLDKLKPKTKEFYKFLIENLKFNPKKEKILIVVEKLSDNIWRGLKNIENVAVLEVSLLNAYDVLRFKKIAFDQKGISKIKTVFLSKVSPKA